MYFLTRNGKVLKVVTEWSDALYYRWYFGIQFAVDNGPIRIMKDGKEVPDAVSTVRPRSHSARAMPPRLQPGVTPLYLG